MPTFRSIGETHESKAQRAEDARARRRSRARHAWRYSPRRHALEAMAEDVLARPLGDVFGRWCLQLGACERDLTERTATLRHVRCAPWTYRDGQLVADDCMLPLASGSVDAVVLCFALEFSARPHRLVREANRVLNDRGILVVVGQSPHGLAALPRLLGMSGRALPAGTGLVRPGRLRDWLDLLDFEVEAHHGFGNGWPWRGATRGPVGRAMADCYALVARKRVLPLTPMRRPLRAPRAAPAPGAVVSNFSRRNREDGEAA